MSKFSERVLPLVGALSLAGLTLTGCEKKTSIAVPEKAELKGKNLELSSHSEVALNFLIASGERLGVFSNEFANSLTAKGLEQKRTALLPYLETIRAGEELEYKVGLDTAKDTIKTLRDFGSPQFAFDRESKLTTNINNSNHSNGAQGGKASSPSAAHASAALIKPDKTNNHE